MLMLILTWPLSRTITTKHSMATSRASILHKCISNPPSSSSYNRTPAKRSVTKSEDGTGEKSIPSFLFLSLLHGHMFSLTIPNSIPSGWIYDVCTRNILLPLYYFSFFFCISNWSLWFSYYIPIKNRCQILVSGDAANVVSLIRIIWCFYL